MLKETKTTTQSKIPFLWLQSRLPIHKREFSRIGWTTAARVLKKSENFVLKRKLCGGVHEWREISI
jgi:hypothetical protein